MINELLSSMLTGHNGDPPQAVDIANGEFSKRPGTEADTPRTPGNAENPEPWLPCQWLGYSRGCV